ncbi:MAG: hypothetical protein OES09_09415 [Gammaproteobacteria bacterium]|nr:hypothetical protein [Gammaproteobacteria bacterium]
MKTFEITPRINLALARAQMALKDKQKGLTTVEYAVAGALVAATLVGAFAALGNQVENVIDGLTNSIGG